jgi:hypothetical protein
MVRGRINISKELLILIQTLEVEIKKTIVEGFLKGKSKEDIQNRIYGVIAEITKEVEIHNKDLFIIGMRESARRWYLEFNEKAAAAQMLIPAYSSNRGKKPEEILRNVNNPNAIVKDSLYDYMERGNPHMANYQSKVKQAVRDLAEKPLKAPTIRGKPLSMRNLAEMSVRYEKQLDDIQEFKDKDVNLVWTSSHADCSKRCEKWQGKLYSLDGTYGSIDGISYIPLETATSDNEGNSIILGYNCRHYLKEYKKGTLGPKEYREGTIKKQRAIDQKQRYMERQIVKLRTEALLLRDVDKVESLRLNEKAGLRYKEYAEFSQANERAVNHWRTQIVRYDV